MTANVDREWALERKTAGQCGYFDLGENGRTQRTLVLAHKAVVDVERNDAVGAKGTTDKRGAHRRVHPAADEDENALVSHGRLDLTDGSRCPVIHCVPACRQPDGGMECQVERCRNLGEGSGSQRALGLRLTGAFGDAKEEIAENNLPVDCELHFGVELNSVDTLLGVFDALTQHDRESVA